jgi:hypothetical protein
MTSILESQRHPELNQAENDAIRLCREFLTRVVNDAIEQGEFAAPIDANALIETLLVVLCGAGFYAGFVQSYREMQAVIGVLGQLLEGALFKGPGQVKA